jgi:hypothetical protein
MKIKIYIETPRSVLPSFGMPSALSFSAITQKDKTVYDYSEFLVETPESCSLAAHPTSGENCIEHRTDNGSRFINATDAYDLASHGMLGFSEIATGE